jgi:endonuclease/exonuclease/phosphatase family metal-dependent hydrolase
MSELTIVTFNIHGGIETRGISVPRLWTGPRRRAEVNAAYDVVGVMSELEADVVAIQESWRPDDGRAAVDDLAEKWSASLHEAAFGRGTIEPYPHITNYGQLGGTFGVAVLSRIPARLVGTLPVGRVLADPATDRCALHLEVDVGDVTVDLIAVHLTSRLPYGPPTQLRRLRAQLPPPGRPALLLGDFNFWGPPVARLLPGWRQVVRGRTWPALRPHSQIDHVFVRGAVEVVDAAVLPDVGSDHRPVRVTLRF